MMDTTLVINAHKKHHYVFFFIRDSINEHNNQARNQ
jgi:hypothetical protein